MEGRAPRPSRSLTGRRTNGLRPPRTRRPGLHKPARKAEARAISTIALPIVKRGRRCGRGNIEHVQHLARRHELEIVDQGSVGLQSLRSHARAAGNKILSVISGSRRWSARTKAGFESERCHSSRPLRQCWRAIRQKPGKQSATPNRAR